VPVENEQVLHSIYKAHHVMAHLPLERCYQSEKSQNQHFSLYAIKVACTAGKKKATLFLERIGSGAIRYQSKKGG